MSGTTEVFHSFTGKNISLIGDGQRARRKDVNMVDSAVVFSKEPLKPDSNFQVKVTDTNVSQWCYTLYKGLLLYIMVCKDHVFINIILIRYMYMREVIM